MMYIHDHAADDVYKRVLRWLLNPHCPSVEPRGKMTREVRNALLEVAGPSDLPIVTADEERNKKIAKYTAEEFRLYASGEDQTAEFAKVAPFWVHVGNDDGTINSSYGKLVWYEQDMGKFPTFMTPWQWCKESLHSDPSTRQAILMIARPYHLRTTRDVVCTMHGCFHIRSGKLHYTTVMRSNDVVRGLVYDMPWFMHLQILMAKELGIQVGSYTHFVHSLHMYESDRDMAVKMVGE